MGWSIGYDEQWKRDIGYGVPAYCDHPDCSEEIDRGLVHVCGGEPYGGMNGCGLYFCGQHHGGNYSICQHCETLQPPFKPKADHPKWINHKLTDPSWQQWRDENQAEVARLISEGQDSGQLDKTPYRSNTEAGNLANSGKAG